MKAFNKLNDYEKAKLLETLTEEERQNLMQLRDGFEKWGRLFVVYFLNIKTKFILKIINNPKDCAKKSCKMRWSKHAIWQYNSLENRLHVSVD